VTGHAEYVAEKLTAAKTSGKSADHHLGQAMAAKELVPNSARVQGPSSYWLRQTVPKMEIPLEVGMTLAQAFSEGKKDPA